MDIMKKVFLFMTLSLDGYFEGPNNDLSWHQVDDDFNRLAIDLLKKTDIILFGRRTYQLMEAFWPKAAVDPTITEDNIEIARLINNTNKIVFSKTLDKVEERDQWKNVKLVHDFDPDEIRRMKEGPGLDILVGGSDLAVSFIRAGLIDEFLFIIAPVVIGSGTKIFNGLDSKLGLELLKVRRFESGNLLLHYRQNRSKK